MRKSLCAVALVLAGCAGYIDESAVPRAEIEWKLALDRCSTAQVNFPAEGLDCLLAADRALVSAIKLREMAVFDAYAQRQRIAFSEGLTGKLTEAEYRARFIENRQDLFRAIDQGNAADKARRARTAAALSGLGAGLQQAGAAYNAGAYSASPTRPVTCTTVPGRLDGGGTATTTCY